MAHITNIISEVTPKSKSIESRQCTCIPCWPLLAVDAAAFLMAGLVSTIVGGLVLVCGGCEVAGI